MSATTEVLPPGPGFGEPDAEDLRQAEFPPVMPVAISTLVLIVAGGIVVAAQYGRPPKLTVPVVLLGLAALLLIVNAILVARHGSWNRSEKVGGDVVVVKLNKDGTVKSIEPLVTGFLEDNKYVGRPVDVLQMKDGSVLVSDDWNGAVYRISYGKPKVATQ